MPEFLLNKSFGGLHPLQRRHFVPFLASLLVGQELIYRFSYQKFLEVQKPFYKKVSGRRRQTFCEILNHDF